MNKKNINFFNIQKINQKYENVFKNLFNDFLNSKNIILGEKTHEFEKNFAKYCGVSHCLGISNGLDALKLILKAYIEMGVFAKGDEILVPANTYIASILSISESGLKPVLIEPDLRTYNIDFDKIEKRISKKTKGVMIVHLYGRIAMSENLYNIAEKFNLKIIEDSAQAHGAIYGGKKAGALGDSSGFSFYPTKNLGALGEAGAITTNDYDLFDILKYLRNYGSVKRYYNEYKGFNCRIDEFQAAILNEKLKNLDKDNDVRRNNAQYLIQGINNSKILLPEEVGDSHVWHLFVVRVKDRNNFISFLEEKNIQTIIHYPIPPHHQNAYSEMKDDKFPISEQIHNSIVSLPSNIHLDKSDLDYIIDACNEY